MTNAPPREWPSLQRAARRAGISLTKLAERIGTSRQSVSAYANGARRPSEQTIRDLAHALGTSYDNLCVDMPFATREQDPREELAEINNILTVVSNRLREIEEKRDQLSQLVQVPA